MTDSPKFQDLFPCRRVPDDGAAARLLGVYPQAQEGRFMQRVKIPGGRLTGSQWRAFAAVARCFTPGVPLHLTTRQDIEIHDLTALQIPDAQRHLHDARMTCLGACGDTLRNVTICPCAGLGSDNPELLPLARRIDAILTAMQGIDRLPRKFKVAIACGDRCGQPFINDLALVLARRDGRHGFQAVAAGSLGASPATGIVYREWIEVSEAAALALGAVRVFAAHGDRENRRKARLRHVRQRLGDEAFVRLLDAAFAEARSELASEPGELPAGEAEFTASRELAFPDGDMTPEAADALARLADEPGLRVRIANQHRVVVFGRSASALGLALSGQPVLAQASQPSPVVVACPGNRWCSRALVDTTALAGRIRGELAGVIPPGAAVCISGCPNGCAHTTVADVGLSGRVSDGAEVYDLYLGGGMGRDERLAEKADVKLSGDRVVEAIRARYGHGQTREGRP